MNQAKIAKSSVFQSLSDFCSSEQNSPKLPHRIAELHQPPKHEFAQICCTIGHAHKANSLLSHSQFRSLPSALSPPQSNLPQYHGTTTPLLQRPSLRLHPLFHHASPVSTSPPSDLALKFEISSTSTSTSTSTPAQLFSLKPATAIISNHALKIGGNTLVCGNRCVIGNSIHKSVSTVAGPKRNMILGKSGKGIKKKPCIS
ncbi:hypothetical protein LguiA_005471 [Lonicera macranthoides]